MVDTATNYPALRAVIDEEYRSRSAENAKRESELDTVARLMAERATPDFFHKPIEESFVYQYWSPEFEHMRCYGWWDDQLLYSAFMYLLWLSRELAPPDWAAKMIQRGNKLQLNTKP